MESVNAPKDGKSNPCRVFFSGFHSRGGKYIAANFKQRQIQIQGGGGNTTTPILHTMYMYYREANFQRRGGGKST